MRAFEHAGPRSTDQVIRLLMDRPTARPIAGGTDLIPSMRLGILAPTLLVNLKSVDGLDRVEAAADGLRIGALARLADLAGNPLIGARLPTLATAINLTASAQIRAMATLGGSLCQGSRCWYFRGQFHCWLKGGSICHAERGDNRRQAILGGGPCYTVHPSDPATALVALAARVKISGPKGERWSSLEEFFTIPRDEHRALTDLQPGEILTAVETPWPAPGERSSFLKAGERADFGFSLASVACVVGQDRGTVTTARIVLGAVAPVPWRATAAEQTLLGHPLDHAAIERAAAVATTEARPLAMNGYKIPLVQALVRRALSGVASTA